MSALMNIGQQALTMTSREIAELTQKRHDHVLRDIEGMLTVLGETSPQIWGDLPDGYGRPQRVAFLSKELTITLVSGYSIQMRHAIVCRWQELEARQAPALPQTMAQALRLAAEQAEALEKQQALLEAAKPKVEFVDKFVQASTGSRGFREVCKLLKANEAEFRCFVIDRRIMYRLAGKLTAHQNHIDAGRFEVKAGVAGNEHAYTTTKFTAKGVEWIAGEWAKHKVSVTLSEAA